jgi:hypothetical protein
MRPIERDDGYEKVEEGWENHDDPDPPDEEETEEENIEYSYAGPIPGTCSSEYTDHVTLTYASDLTGEEDLDVVQDLMDDYTGELESIAESMEAECDYSAEVSGYGDFEGDEDGDEDGDAGEVED